MNKVFNDSIDKVYFTRGEVAIKLGIKYQAMAHLIHKLGYSGRRKFTKRNIQNFAKYLDTKEVYHD